MFKKFKPTALWILLPSMAGVLSGCGGSCSGTLPGGRVISLECDGPFCELSCEQKSATAKTLFYVIDMQADTITLNSQTTLSISAESKNVSIKAKNGHLGIYVDGKVVHFK